MTDFDLKLCPHCGGTPKYQLPERSTFEQYQPSTHARIWCSECEAQVEVSAHESSPMQSCVDRWNKRFASAPEVKTYQTKVIRPGGDD